MKRVIWFSFVILMYLFLELPDCQAQDGKVNSQFWLDLTLSHKINDHFGWYGDGGYRQNYGTEQAWKRAYVRPSIKYTFNSWMSARGGIGGFYTARDSSSNTFELRPWQGIHFAWPKYSKIKFSHYFRLEQRWIYNTSSWNNSFDIRYRYQLSTRFQPNPSKKVNYFYFPAFVELFANQKLTDEIKEPFTNEMRVGLGIGYPWADDWSGQFMFIFQRSRNELGNFKTSDLLFRISIQHKLLAIDPLH